MLPRLASRLRPAAFKIKNASSLPRRNLSSSTSSSSSSSGGAYNGFKTPHVNPVHRRLGTAMGAVMWFWVFYRLSQDGDVMLGYRKPWEHKHDDHHDEHGEHGH